MSDEPMLVPVDPGQELETQAVAALPLRLACNNLAGVALVACSHVAMPSMPAVARLLRRMVLAMWVSHHQGMAPARH